MRTKVILACDECLSRNYSTVKNKQTQAGRQVPRDPRRRGVSVPHSERDSRRDRADGQGWRHAGVFHLLRPQGRERSPGRGLPGAPSRI